jgi:hypothetical protein
VKNWTDLNSLDWALDGKGLFATSQLPNAPILLHVDLEGKARVLWKQTGTFETWSWTLPAPDDRSTILRVSAIMLPSVADDRTFHHISCSKSAILAVRTWWASGNVMRVRLPFSSKSGESLHAFHP